MQFRTLQTIVGCGEKIELPNFEYDVWVHPVGFRHIRKLFSEVPAALSALQEAKDGGEETMETVVSRLPELVERFSSIIEECSVFIPKGTDPEKVKDEGFHLHFDDLPHYIPVIIGDKWVALSFSSEEQRRPWMEVIGKITKKLTGKELDWTSIWEMSSQT